MADLRDRDVEAAIRWFLDGLSPDEWEKRSAATHTYIQRFTDASELSKISLSDERARVAHFADWISWYLYLGEAYCSHDPCRYDYSQGARVIPFLKGIGRNLEYLCAVKGVEDRRRVALLTKRNDPDSAIFELLVAASYVRNGWKRVEFLPEHCSQKSPDILADSGRRQLFVECKRLEKTSAYSTRERQKWLAMWEPLSEFLKQSKLPVVLEIMFHAELEGLPVGLLRDLLIPKLRFCLPEGTIVDNTELTVKMRCVDYEAIANRFKENRIAYGSPAFIFSLFGEFDCKAGYAQVVQLAGDSLHFSYADEVLFFAGAKWTCDSPSAAEKKARHVKRHLARGYEQIPLHSEGVVHIGIESVDSPTVRHLQSLKNSEVIREFHSGDKNAYWTYLHIFDPRMSPTCLWEFYETLEEYPAAKGAPPLSTPQLIALDSD